MVSVPLCVAAEMLSRVGEYALPGAGMEAKYVSPEVLMLQTPEASQLET